MTKEKLEEFIKNADNKTLATMYKEAVKEVIDKYEVCPKDNQLILPVFDSKGQLRFKIRTYTGLFIEVKEDNLEEYESLLSAYMQQKRKLEAEIERLNKKYKSLLNMLVSAQEEFTGTVQKVRYQKVSDKLDLLYEIKDHCESVATFKNWLNLFIKKTEKELEQEKGE